MVANYFSLASAKRDVFCGHISLKCHIIRSVLLAIFLARDSIMMIIAHYICYRRSVCLSVCHTGGSLKTVEARIMQLLPQSSPMTAMMMSP